MYIETVSNAGIKCISPAILFLRLEFDYYKILPEVSYDVCSSYRSTVYIMCIRVERVCSVLTNKFWLSEKREKNFFLSNFAECSMLHIPVNPQTTSTICFSFY